MVRWSCLVAKKSPTYPWNIPQTLEPTCLCRKSLIKKSILGYLGYVPGVCWNFLRKMEPLGLTTNLFWVSDRLHPAPTPGERTRCMQVSNIKCWVNQVPEKWLVVWHPICNDSNYHPTERMIHDTGSRETSKILKQALTNKPPQILAFIVDALQTLQISKGLETQQYQTQSLLYLDPRVQKVLALQDPGMYCSFCGLKTLLHRRFTTLYLWYI